MSQERSKSRKYLQAIMDSLDDELMVVDRELRITEVNAALLRNHNLSRAAAIGSYCYQVSHCQPEPCLPPDCECPVRTVFQTGKAMRVRHTHSYGPADKEPRIVDIIASPLKDSEGQVTEAVELMRDVTEATRLEEQIRKANQDLSTLNSIARIVSQSLNLDTVLNSALDEVLTVMKGNIGGILLLDEESQTLSYQAYRGLSQEFIQGIARLRVGEGIAGRVAQSGEPIIVDDISKDPRLTRPVVVREELRGFASVPLRSKNKLVGVMNIASHEPRQFTTQDVELLHNIANQIAIAIENAKLYDELQRKEQARGELLRQLISAQEEERKRIARELHDETSQALTSLAIGLEAAVATVPLACEDMRPKLKRMQSLALATLDEIEKVIYELRPSLLDDLGLIAAVRWYAESRFEVTGTNVNVEVTGPERKLPVQMETDLFRIIQEAVNNIARHAEAETASITLGFRDDRFTAHIEDDGQGFDYEQVMSSREGQRGLGLLGMKERVELLGGILSINSRPGLGTEIDVEISWQEVVDG